MDIKIAEVCFRGNKEKTYDFYTTCPCLTDDEDTFAVVNTKNGPALGTIIKLKSFSERSKECNQWVIHHFTQHDVYQTTQCYEPDLQAAELKELLGE
ncbi:hypothetical protein P22_1991 [Propionispora sp. 2/2-37]|uniref:hypothetical protein n=1 Tax=Propionispora sp. 2/2-37 TaxID=1677858 RepID=UPI0006BB7AAF|nr:hypothetical protein [Propionispora sp. 2/2-37]CUH95905.1 hypothetical protein P22_1991 [Propionispora sp. 2/2-37]